MGLAHIVPSPNGTGTNGTGTNKTNALNIPLARCFLRGLDGRCSSVTNMDDEEQDAREKYKEIMRKIREINAEIKRIQAIIKIIDRCIAFTNEGMDEMLRVTQISRDHLKGLEATRTIPTREIRRLKRAKARLERQIGEITAQIARIIEREYPPL
jgi:chromosome segregation ATPase